MPPHAIVLAVGFTDRWLEQDVCPVRMRNSETWVILTDIGATLPVSDCDAPVFSKIFNLNLIVWLLHKVFFI